MSPPLLLDRAGHIVTLTLNRPDQRNALAGDDPFCLFEEHCALVNEDLSVRCVLLTGAGSAFCAGANVKHMRDRTGIFAGDPGQIRANYDRGIQRIPRALWELEVPTIAAVNGPAIGAGCDLACMCDIRLASQHAVFSESFVKLGIVPGDGGAWLLPRVVGLARACELAFTGDSIDAQEALRQGLVSRVVAGETLAGAVRQLATRIAANPPAGVALDQTADPRRPPTEPAYTAADVGPVSGDHPPHRRSRQSARRPRREPPPHATNDNDDDASQANAVAARAARTRTRNPGEGLRLRIALAQLDSALGDIDENARRAREMIVQARAQGAQLIIFPELSLSGYSLGALDEDIALRPDDPAITALAADAGDIAIVVGFVEQGAVHTYNSAIYLESGVAVHVQRKTFLPTYGLFDERKHFSPGQSLSAFDTRLGRFALVICNDAWQPTLPFIAVHDGAQMLIVPACSSFPAHTEAQAQTQHDWRDLLHFHGRFLQTHVVFVNRVGQEAGVNFWGGSRVVDPWGNVIAEAPLHEPTLFVADLDLAAARRARREMPLVKEARLGLLSRELERLTRAGGDL